MQRPGDESSEQRHRGVLVLALGGCLSPLLGLPAWVLGLSTEGAWVLVLVGFRVFPRRASLVALVTTP